MESRRRRNTGIEANTLVMLDASGSINDHRYVNDDRNDFLEAVRSASIVPEHGIAPTIKMFEAIFHILKNENSLDLLMTSYQLLNQLEKRFPRVCRSKTEKIESPSPHASSLELIVVKEAWSPFIFGLDIAYRESVEVDKSSYIDSAGFHLLVQGLAEVANERKFEAVETKSIRSLLLFQYLVNVLGADFLPRNDIFKETINWILLRDSLLNILLGSRRMNYKGLIKNCLSIMCELGHSHSGSPNNSSNLLKKCDTAVAIALPEVENSTCNAVQKLLLMIMELDLSKKAAEMQGLTTRADAVSGCWIWCKTPLEEIILDELTYNQDFISPFLEVFNGPKRKLDIIVQYFMKYMPKSSIRTRRSTGSTDDMTYNGILKCFSNGDSTKNITKKISIDVVQLLLAHGFQAYLSLASRDSVEGISDFKDDSLKEICKNVISAFTSLSRTNKYMKIFWTAEQSIKESFCAEAEVERLMKLPCFAFP